MKQNHDFTDESVHRNLNFIARRNKMMKKVVTNDGVFICHFIFICVIMSNKAFELCLKWMILFLCMVFDVLPLCPQAAVSMLKQDFKEGEMSLSSALALAIKVLNKTMDVSKLSAEKGEVKTPIVSLYCLGIVSILWLDLVSLTIITRCLFTVVTWVWKSHHLREMLWLRKS